MVDAGVATPPTTADRRGKTKASRVWWAVHQWVGLKLSILLSFIFLTGTLAVFSTEIDWLLRPALRVDAATVAGPTNWSGIALAVAAHAPAARIARIEAPLDRGFAATATLQRPDGTFAFVYAHPSTGAVQGDGDWVSAKRILRNLHRHLMMPTKWGVPIVSSVSILLLISLVTSFVIYKKWWRGFFRPVRFSDARTAMGDFHRLAGLWSLWFVALMVLTGLWYLVESTGLKAPPNPWARVETAGLSTTAAAGRLAPSLEAARAAYPRLRIEAVLFPTEKSGAFVFHGQDRAILVRPRANTVWTEAASGEVRLVTDGRDLTIHQRISEMADPLHFGTWGGLPSKIAWCVFGVLLTGLSVSGVAIFGLRLLRAERQPASFGNVLARAWTGMGWWRWPALAFVLTGFALIPKVFGFAGD